MRRIENGHKTKGEELIRYLQRVPPLAFIYYLRDDEHACCDRDGDQRGARGNSTHDERAIALAKRLGDS
jgi:hypothetical protein